MWCIYVTGISWDPHAHIYLPMSFTMQDRVMLCLDLSVAWVTYYYSQQVIIIIINLKINGGKEMMTGQGCRMAVWVLVGVTGCVPRPRGIVWLHCFSFRVD
jgi:hypothetical protein